MESKVKVDKSGSTYPATDADQIATAGQHSEAVRRLLANRFELIDHRAGQYLDAKDALDTFLKSGDTNALTRRRLQRKHSYAAQRFQATAHELFYQAVKTGIYCCPTTVVNSGALPQHPQRQRQEAMECSARAG